MRTHFPENISPTTLGTLLQEQNLPGNWFFFNEEIVLKLFDGMLTSDVPVQVGYASDPHSSEEQSIIYNQGELILLSNSRHNNIQAISFDTYFDSLQGITY